MGLGAIESGARRLFLSNGFVFREEGSTIPLPSSLPYLSFFLLEVCYIVVARKKTYLK